VRVRIKTAPLEQQIDGIPLENLVPGAVKDVSTSLGTWLVAQGYAELEMRSVSADSFQDAFSSLSGMPNDRRRQPR